MILMYHKVHPNSPSMWWVSVNNFYRQMTELKGKKVVYLENYNPEDENEVVITFDGIYKNVLEYALPILKHFNYPFELFLNSDYLGTNNEFDSVEPNAEFVDLDDLRLLVDNGGRLQWHTKSHPNLKDWVDTERINEELIVPDALKEIDTVGFTWFAYPHGEFNEIVVQEVKKKFKGAVSCIQGNNYDKYILNRLTVVNSTRLRENKIACIIASYNYGDFLIEAIESVLRQTVLPDEILITDDCSEDDTQIIAETYVKKFPELIRYNRNEKNLGVVDNFNKAISLTNSNYIVILGADNVFMSNYIEECALKLDSDSSIAIAYTDFVLYGSRAKIVYDTFREEFKSDIVEGSFYNIKFPECKNKSEANEFFKKSNFIHGSSMFRRDAFDKVGGYKKTSKPEDFNLFYEMINEDLGLIKSTNTKLMYRQHSAGQLNNLVSLHNKIKLFKSEIESFNTFKKSRIYKLAFLVYSVKGMSFKTILRKIKKMLIS
ncbi:glycosyltransferase [Flavobacterium sp.]|uniref:glycosyltransferase n=1 Tax=Flavobacterium sp. TaxID=239 RepID=UPI003D0A3779